MIDIVLDAVYHFLNEPPLRGHALCVTFVFASFSRRLQWQLLFLPVRGRLLSEVWILHLLHLRALHRIENATLLYSRGLEVRLEVVVLRLVLGMPHAGITRGLLVTRGTRWELFLPFRSAVGPPLSSLSVLCALSSFGLRLRPVGLPV